MPYLELCLGITHTVLLLDTDVFIVYTYSIDSFNRDHFSITMLNIY